MVKPVFVLALLGLILAGCSSSSGGPSGESATSSLPMVRPATGNPVSQYISHVVVIVQENRSFENFFAGYPGANAPMKGKAGSKTIKLKQITFNGPDIEHSWRSSIADWNKGKMNGFDVYHGPYPKYAAYSYVERSLVQPYWTMAQQYVLADAMFPTEFGGSFTGHLTLVAGTDDLTPKEAEVDIPSLPPDDCDSPPGTSSSYVTPDRVVHSFKGPISVLHAVQHDGPGFGQCERFVEVLRDGAPGRGYVGAVRGDQVRAQRTRLD